MVRKLFALPWHSSTYLVAAATALLMVVISFPGEITSPLAGNFGGAYTATYDHGWPLTFLSRGYRYDFSQSKMFPDIPQWGVPWMAWDSWEIWEMNNARSPWTGKEANVWKPISILVDIGTAALVTMAAAMLWERRRRRLQHILGFSLRDAIVATTAAACLLGWGVHAQRGRTYELELVETLEGDGTIALESWIAPRWLQRLVGVENLPEFFLRVDEVQFHDMQPDKFQSAIRVCNDLRWLKSLDLVSYNIPLEMLLAELKALPRLQILKLGCRGDLSADQIESFAQLRQLEFLLIDGASDADLEELQARLPNCKVTSDWADLDWDW